MKTNQSKRHSAKHTAIAVLVGTAMFASTNAKAEDKMVVRPSTPAPALAPTLVAENPHFVGPAVASNQRKPSPLWGPYYSSVPVPGIPNDLCSNAELKRTPVSCGLRQDLRVPPPSDRARDMASNKKELIIAGLITGVVLVAATAVLLSGLEGLGGSAATSLGGGLGRGTPGGGLGRGIL
ncbi:MAG: hypothetical protein KBF88_12590 [Polyangiaceae bacterium]|nr:hypothetical protein [Polyangiaceae bacterium]